MGEVTKIDTFQAAKPDAKDIPAETAAKIAAEAKASVGRGVASPVTPPPAPVAPDPDRPAWLDPKFKTPEDMAKAYKELEKKQGSQGEKKVEPPKGTTGLAIEPAKAPDGTITPDPKSAEAVVAKAGLDMAALSTEYQKNGELSADSLKALEGVGITKDVVDLYIEGQKALVAQRVADIESVAGSPEKFEQMRAWGATNLSPTEIEAINKACTAGDHQAIKMAYTAVHAKWMAAGQNEPEQIRGGRAEPTVDVYTHRDEIKADMRKPEYKTNEAFRAKVMAKVSRSNIW